MTDYIMNISCLISILILVLYSWCVKYLVVYYVCLQYILKLNTAIDKDCKVAFMQPLTHIFVALMFFSPETVLVQSI